MALTLTTPFVIPIALASHPDAATLNPELRKLFLDKEAQGARYANPRATMKIGGGLFESRFDLFNWPDAPIRRLRDFCWENLYSLIFQLSQYDQAALRKMQGHSDAWFHITRRGGGFGMHNHPMASWSGVYCVDDGASDSDRPDSGLLSFPNPFALASMFVDAGNGKLKMPYNASTREYRLVPGQLVLFPSWLMHQVTTFHGEGTRITVAFNAWFTMDN